MPRPSPSLSRYLLLTAPSPSQRDPNAAKVRRYRLARIQVTGHPQRDDRFAHLRRVYE